MKITESKLRLIVRNEIMKSEKMRQSLSESDTPKTDLKGTQCTQCNLGEYQETTIYDDWQGNLHCTQCNHKIKRYENSSQGAVPDFSKYGLSRSNA
jgi:hypothetical protein